MKIGAFRAMMVQMSVKEYAVRTKRTGRTYSAREAVKFLRRYARDPREHFFRLDMNHRRRVTGYEIVSVGTMDESLVHPRDVFRGAIVNGAALVMLAHTHPGEMIAVPSDADFEVTREIIEAGNLLGIPVCEHVIIGGGGRPYYMRRRTRHVAVRRMDWY